MNPWFTALREGGPWAVLFLVVVGIIASLLFALSRGILVRGGEVDRIERRIEKDTDRVLELYREQMRELLAANAKKDETIASQDRQIEKLIASNDTATQALDKIVREAEKRGFFST